MKRVIVIGMGSAFFAAALLGAGTATAAPDVVGMKYSDAKKEIRESGGRATVATRVGAQLDENQCIVTNVWDASFLRIARADNDEVAVALNCNGEYATATNPGTSVANPLGREAKAEDEAEAARKRAQRQAAQQEERELAAPVTPNN